VLLNLYNFSPTFTICFAESIRNRFAHDQEAPLIANTAMDIFATLRY